MSQPFILASRSPERLRLLRQIGVPPDSVIPADIDETPRTGEHPRHLARRLAAEKTRHIAASHPDAAVLGADTVVAHGRTALPGPDDRQTAQRCMTVLSGRAHRVHTAICLMTPSGMWEKCAVARVTFKRLAMDEIAAYLDTGEWRGRAGGYAINGCAGGFIRQISGSPSAVAGLPLFETAALLRGIGLMPRP